MNTASDEHYPHCPKSLGSFAPRILTWFEHSGRHDLPWQQHKQTTPNPYPVWLSEVMLQQTQVATVIPYFERFMASFPTVQDLANADWEKVAEHWAGLGYYARARNLHKGAKQLVEIIEQTGDFPQTVADWESIAGVGLSTAGAIVAMGVRSTQEKGVICDGNVKRVLTRWAGIDGDIAKTATTKQLWQLADRLTPNQNSGEYAQAMMDMGATLCTKSKPSCLLCPVQEDCIANREGKQSFYPVKSKKAPNPSKFSLALKLSNGETNLWLQRPDNGIWGGLWCLPLAFIRKEKAGKTIENWQKDEVFDNEYTTAEQIIFEFLQAEKLLDFDNITLENHTTIKHSLTHFHWFLTAFDIQLSKTQIDNLEKKLIKAEQVFSWKKFDESKILAQPKAMQTLLNM
ncbi:MULTISPECIES: A/G-specific adenine glycosylase [unclassified Moraxella]|uniref:A/G-specific adenine glycosylase n=1 Tax=unclassified Moraxella TaxID=2685852 RepID=UPI003AF5C538